MEVGSDDDAGACTPEELAHILRYRLSVPVVASPDSFAGPRASDSTTFGAALHDATAPPDLLMRVKEFARRSRLDPDSDVPPEVSTLLYYASMAAALVRDGRRLDPLDDVALARGLAWASDQSWADESSLSLVHRGLQLLRSSGVTPAVEDAPGLPPVGPGALDEKLCAARLPRIPGYRITMRLGEGGMGTVWRAEQLSTKREVALKLVSPGAVGSHKARLRFQREVELAARLEHPAIARVYESGMSGGQLFYAMELVDGVHLDRYAAEQKLDARQILSLVREVCLAVTHAHQRGVIHRDLKPSNILITADGRPKVLDFGLAKATDAVGDGDLTVTHDGHLAGTPAFMSPEQAAGDSSKLDIRTDVYSLGATLYLLFVGHHPHDTSAARYEVLRRIAQDEVRRPRLLRKELDSEVEALLLKALARDRNDRYASAAELAADIKNYLDGKPIAAKPATAGYVARKWVQKHWRPSAVAAALALSLVTAAAWGYSREARLRRVAESKANEALHANQVAEQNNRAARLALAQSKIAEGDARVAADDFATARQRYEEAWSILAAHGAATFPAELALWDAYRKSPPPLLELTGHAAKVNCAAFVADGRQILSGSEDGTVRLWDGWTGRTIRVLTGVGRVQELAVSPDGKKVALAGVGRGLTIWDIERGDQIGELTGFDGDAVSVAYSPDGAKLLVGTTDKQRNAYLYDAASRKLLRTLDGHGAAVRAVAFSPDGRRAFTGSGRRPHDVTEFFIDATLRAWDVANGRQLWVKGADGGLRLVSDVAVSPDGSAVITTNYHGRTICWDKDTGETKWQERSSENQINAAAYSPDGSLIAVAAADGIVQILWADSGKPLEGNHTRTLFPGGETAIAFAPDGKSVLAAAGNSVRVWPVFETVAHRSFTQDTQMLNHTDPEEVGVVALSPDGRLALSCTLSTNTLRLWDTEFDEELRQIEAAGRTPETGEAWDEYFRPAVFLPDGSGILVAERGGTVATWDLALEERQRSLEPWGDHKAASVAVSPTGRRALVRFWGSDTLQLYDLPSGRRVRSLELAGGVNIDRILFSPDGALAAACSRESGVRVWEVETGRERHAVNPHRVNDIAFSPDGSFLACAGVGLSLLDIRTGSVTSVSDDWGRQYFAADFFPHPGTGTAVTAGEGGVVSLCPSAPPLTREAESVRRVKTAATAYIYDLAVSADGRKVVAAQRSPTGNVQMFDMSLPARLRRHKQSLAQATQWLNENPKNGDALRVFGEWYAMRQHWNRAADLLEQARAERAEVPPLMLAKCYWRAFERDDHWQRAVAELSRAKTMPKTASEAAASGHLLREATEQASHPAPRQIENRYVNRVFAHPYFMLSQLHTTKGNGERALRLARAARAGKGDPLARARQGRSSRAGDGRLVGVRLCR